MSKWVYISLCVTLIDFKTFNGDKECSRKIWRKEKESNEGDLIIKGNKENNVGDLIVKAHALSLSHLTERAQKTVFQKNIGKVDFAFFNFFSDGS